MCSFGVVYVLFSSPFWETNFENLGIQLLWEISMPTTPTPSSTLGVGLRWLRNAQESHLYLFETVSGQGEVREALNSLAIPENHRYSADLPNFGDSNDEADFMSEEASENDIE